MYHYIVKEHLLPQPAPQLPLLLLVAQSWVAGAITGAIGRDQLEDAVRKLEAEISKFGTLSEKYTDTIYEVLAEVKISEIN